MNHRDISPVLILGAGINGCAVARDLAINGLPVVLVDRFDVASGTTAKSSRLIHGGLRYLEYREFDLVRESLAERRRLLRLAPQYVRPLRLFIPIRKRLGGVASALGRFIRRSGAGGERGLYLVRAGLGLYNWFARDPALPGPAQHPVADPGTPLLNRRRYRWLCAYTDAQILHPERFVLALLEDARRAASEAALPFAVYTYHEACRSGRSYRIVAPGGEVATHVEPSVVVNATGPWGDDALGRLQIAAPRLIGGTKGSHLVTFHAGLAAALGNRGVYAEAPDGRLVFVLPLVPGVLIGTTDEPFDAPPETARASDAEIDYLLQMVNALFPDVGLTRAAVALHQCGVRPLPFVPATAPTAITRRHFVQETTADGIPILTLIGGKLTTCRSFAESVTDRVLQLIGQKRRASTHDRPVPGAEGYPANDVERERLWQSIARRHNLSVQQVAAVWKLLGTRTEEALAASPSGGGVVADTDLPASFVRWVIANEWVTCLLDLVERRLLLLYEPSWTVQTIADLARLLVEAGRPAADVAGTVRHLSDRYGLALPESAPPFDA